MNEALRMKHPRPTGFVRPGVSSMANGIVRSIGKKLVAKTDGTIYFRRHTRLKFRLFTKASAAVLSAWITVMSCGMNVK